MQLHISYKNMLASAASYQEVWACDAAHATLQCVLRWLQLTGIDPKVLPCQVIKHLQQLWVAAVVACPQPRVCSLVAVAPHHSRHIAIFSAEN